MSAALASKRVGLYARYSSANQREASIEDQLRRCADFVRGLGGTVDDALVFSDAAISGSSLARPAFERLMSMVDAGQVDTIVTEDMSRISRDFADSAVLFRHLQHRGVALIGVGDGIDTSATNAKVAFTIKSLVSDLYLDDLRDKTKRGLEGRCRAGFSTGGLPYGYATESAQTPDGREIGRRIVVVDEAAAVVRRVFDLYRAGASYASIAKLFNQEEVPFARLKTRHRRKGWVASSVRAVLHNPAYIGVWSYNRSQWRKEPGTNTRRPRARPASEVITRIYEDRRIIDQGLWDAVRERAAAVSAKYSNKSGVVKAPGHRTEYPLSGLLVCGICGAAMVVSSGTSATYYSCGDARKRGTCANNGMVREDLLRTAVFAAVRDALFTPTAVAYLRRRIAERLRATIQTGGADLDERVARLRRTEERIGGLVKFISEGDESAYVRATLKDLEAQARIDAAAIDELRRAMRVPVSLPSPDQLLDRARDLERVLSADPMAAREALRGVFVGGRIEIHPAGDRSYVAHADFLPLVAIADGSEPATTVDPLVLALEIDIPKPLDRRFKKGTPAPEGDQ